jgi:hypothetical protein
MFKEIRSATSIVLLSLLLFNFSYADEVSAPSTQSFMTRAEAITLAQKEGKIFHPLGTQYIGTSKSLITAEKDSYNNAVEEAKKSTELLFYVDRSYNEQVTSWGISGITQHVTVLNSFSLVNLTPENLLAEIKVGSDSYLFDYAKKPEFKSLTKDYKEIVRARNYEKVNGQEYLVQLIILHEGKDCADDLMKWAKHHNNSGARLASYLGLIQFGKSSEVDEILKSEPSISIKNRVQKALI